MFACRYSLFAFRNVHFVLRGAERRSNLLLIIIALVIARHEVPKQPPFNHHRPCHCEARSAEATPF